MNTFFAILTVFAAPVDVASNAPLTLQPQAVIEFGGTTERQANTNCERVAKALTTSRVTAYCSDAIEAGTSAE